MSHTAFTLVYIVLMLITQRLTAHLHSVKSPPYVINLDPAVHYVPYPANIGDHLLLILFISLSVFLSQILRDTVKYKQVMSQQALLFM